MKNLFIFFDFSKKFSTINYWKTDFPLFVKTEKNIWKELDFTQKVEAREELKIY